MEVCDRFKRLNGKRCTITLFMLNARCEKAHVLIFLLVHKIHTNGACACVWVSIGSVGVHQPLWCAFLPFEVSCSLFVIVSVFEYSVWQHHRHTPNESVSHTAIYFEIRKEKMLLVFFLLTMLIFIFFRMKKT